MTGAKKEKPEVVVVTGGSAGLGRAIVQAFARDGAHIGLIARHRDRLEATRVEVERLGGKGLVFQADVAQRPSTELPLPSRKSSVRSISGSTTQ